MRRWERRRKDLHFRNQPYRYVMGWDHFGKPWADAARRCLPPASHAGKRGRRADHTDRGDYALSGRAPGPDAGRPNAAAQADEVFEGAHELFRPLNPPVPPHRRPVCRLTRGLSSHPSCPFRRFRTVQARHSGPFFLGSNACYRISAPSHIDLAHFMDEAIRKDYPRLRDFMAAMHGLPGLATYLAERPELTDVGVGPKLVIDGRPVPTGVIAD